MTTVLSVGNSEGERRCDARCHDAAKGECGCVCGGRYHGAGRTAVLARVQQDVLGGVFGETVAVEGHRSLERWRETNPEIVRYHRRAVRKTLRHEAATDQLAFAEARS